MRSVLQQSVVARSSVRQPQMRAVRNTELMLDSSTRALAANGWVSFTLARVAREMGISERPVRNRARSRSDLAAIT